MTAKKTPKTAPKTAEKVKTAAVAKPAPAKEVEVADHKIPKGGANVANLPMDKISIKKGFNPRRDLGDLKDLKSSLREQGIICPITVCPTKEGADTYHVVAGARRFTAWGELAKANIPAVIRTDINIPDGTAFLLAMSENSDDARTALTSEDQTNAFVSLLESLGGEGNESQVAKVCGYSVMTVKRALRFATVPKSVKEAVAKGDIGRTTALAILDVPEESRAAVIAKIGPGTTERDVRILANEAKAELRGHGKVEVTKTKEGHASRHNVPFGQEEGTVSTPRGARDLADMRRKLTALTLNSEADALEAANDEDKVAAVMRLDASRAALAALYWAAGITAELIETPANGIDPSSVATSVKDFKAALGRGVKTLEGQESASDAPVAKKAEKKSKPDAKAEKPAKKAKAAPVEDDEEDAPVAKKAKTAPADKKVAKAKKAAANEGDDE